MPLLQNQPSAPAPIISTIQRDTDSGGSFMPYAMAALSIALLGVLVFGYRLLSLRAKVQEASSQQETLVAEYNSLADVKKRVEDVSALATGLKVAYAAQTPIADLINVLEKTSYKPAKYDSVSIDKKGEVRISGSVATYHDFAKLVKAFKGSDEGGVGITDMVTIDTVSQVGGDSEDSAGTTVTKFGIEFLLKPEVTGQNKTQSTPATTEATQ